MAEIRKIIIPTGADGGEHLPAPHFDAEATLSARRVVPLSEEEARRLHEDYARRAAKPFWRHPAVITLVIIVAAGLGVAAGLAIGNYKNHGASSTVNAQPSPAESPIQTAQQQQSVPPAPTPQPRATIIQEPGPDPVDPKDDESAGKDDDSDRDAQPAPRKEPKSNQSDPEEVTPPRPATRDRKPPVTRGDDDDRAFEDGEAERERRREERWEERRAERREERRRRREEDADDMDIPRRVQRVGDRIRGIFEGRQP